ncbi:iron complex transport system permease protein [Cricetibacter osteomyelitidis]|uniref:Iron complex transport system permease protein n=1 Tax=Cricetibacter osteomyelitidis TaxID=1521931 RepID=A0A4R2TKH8_9PAST|nr:Fe(3+)-hydroxamate ABC transporter permease FhuB [Cricetibacter osteomyelitidis]TCP97798.1 iron complex transport system permease protein [Cricetibacter osteomyelitidis]
MVKTLQNHTALFFILLSIAFVTLFVLLINVQLPENSLFIDLFKKSDNLDLLLVQSYSLPRVTIALLSGGLLGFASLLLQQVMNNPLASDNTLGISSGAQLALFLTAIFFPGWLDKGSAFVAVIGAMISLLFVLCLSWRKAMSPLLLILAGLVVNLYFGSFSALMMLFYPEESRGLAQWGAGSLVQESWRDSQWLTLQAIPIFAVIAMFIRPLGILSLNESNAISLGVPVNRLRVIGVVAASYLIAGVVSAVGMLGFIGLASATIVRQLGVRTFKNQLILAFISGALLLAVTDLILQFITFYYNINLPTGAVTSLLGTPLLLWLMFRALPHTGRVTEQSAVKFRQFSPHFIWLLLIVLGLVCFVTLNFGRYQHGWVTNDFEPLKQLFFELRYPRMITALSVGVLLSIAGVLLQRLTLNPMASPELLGVSSGTGMGVLTILFFSGTQSPSLFWLAGIAGACMALGVLSTINQRNGMLPEKVLLTGISLSALFDTLQRLAIAGGSPRAMQLVSWTSGSTQQFDGNFALPFLLVSLTLLVVSILFSRWLEILNLQAPMAQALGLNLVKVRWILILFSALLTALATLVIGPLSFIGLLVPHLTRSLGVYKAHQQLIVSALLGGLIMVLADWLGRQVMFPYEIPAGLVATLLGGGYFLLMMRKI